jgi:hypothetical protein
MDMGFLLAANTSPARARFQKSPENRDIPPNAVLGVPEKLLKTITIFKKDIDQPTPNAKICVG